MEMVENFVVGQHDIKHVEQFIIKSNKNTHHVTSKNFLKVYKVVSDKRRIWGNSTLPYGY
jgi:hypothetical protein